MSANPRPLIANIYNPHNQTKAELVAGFVVRKKFFEKIFRDIQTSTMQRPEQHYIIQGVRGMGKTTLLLRIAYEIENTDELNTWLIPVVFNEEEYGIGSLSDVWEKVAEYLEESSTEFLGLHQEIIKNYQSDGYERLALDLIIKTLQEKKKKIILLIDNIGDILEKFDEKEEQRLREVLLSTPEIRLIGATSVFLERFFDYKRPFFDFFKYLYLDGLNKAESLELMLKLGEAFHAENIEQIVNNESYRIEVLRRLTGGVVRSMVLLFEIFVENNTGSAFKDLEVLIDRVTPLYKDRMDDLPKQQQKIVAALANFWEAATTKELAEAVRMESKVVSAQLMQLIKNRVVVKIETPTKNHLYRLEERFFNIWYLMRFGRKTDQRMLWLVKFMEDFIGGDTLMLQNRINGHLSALQNETLDPKAALYLTEAFSFLVQEKEQDYLIKTTRTYLEKKDKSLVKELSNSDLEKREFAKKYIIGEKYESAIKCLEELKKKDWLTQIEIVGCKSLLNQPFTPNDLFWESLLSKFDEFMVELGENVITKFQKKISVIGFLILDAYFKDEKDGVEIPDIRSYIILLLFGNHRNKILCAFLIKSRFINILSEPAIAPFEIKLIPMIYLWNNEFEEVENLIRSIPIEVQDFDLFDEALFRLLIAKKQYYFVYQYFTKSNLNIKIEFQPLFYATLHYLKEEYPTEYLRMPPELKETVEELVAEIDQMAIDYA